MKRTEREMRKKHALELKQQPKSLKVSILSDKSFLCLISILNYLISFPEKHLNFMAHIV